MDYDVGTFLEEWACENTFIRLEDWNKGVQVWSGYKKDIPHQFAVWRLMYIDALGNALVVTAMKEEE